LGDVKVAAVPHDLFKLVDWHRHSDRRLIDREFPEAVKGKYSVSYRRLDGREESQSIERIIERHHSAKAFWSRLWSYADRLSTIAARFRLEYDYWHLKGGDPFFVRVYGDIREWSAEDRRSLLKCIMDIFVQYADRVAEHNLAFEGVNELLSEFPADSRVPFTRLKTHHWLTQAIYNNSVF